MFTWEQIEQLEKAGFDTTGFLQEPKPTKKWQKRRKNKMFSNVQGVVLKGYKFLMIIKIISKYFLGTILKVG